MSKYKKKYIDMKLKYVNLKYGGGKSLNIENIQNSIMEINDLSPHSIINCDITQLELDAIKNINIHKNTSSTYNGYGNLDSMNHTLYSFFANMSNNDDKTSTIMTQLVSRIEIIGMFNFVASATAIASFLESTIKSNPGSLFISTIPPIALFNFPFFLSILSLSFFVICS